MSYLSVHSDDVLDRLISLLVQPRRQLLQPSERAKLAAAIAVAEDRGRRSEDRIRPRKTRRNSGI